MYNVVDLYPLYLISQYTGRAAEKNFLPRYLY
nr:MAG TPA: hypothetical protein [Caudoviricetes sp.]